MKFNKTVSLIMSGIAATPVLFLPITSCSEQQIIEDDIIVLNKSIVTYEHTFQIEFELTFPSINEVYVQILDTQMQTLYLEQNIITLNKNKGIAKFIIDDSISQNAIFTFNLKFYYQDSDGQYHNKTVFGFNSYFLTEPIIDLDFPFMLENTDSIVNEHIFNYTVMFLNKPQSTDITVNLIGDETQLLSLSSNTYPIESEGDFYKISIPVNLSMSVFQTSVYSFGLNLEFINSYGYQQKTRLYGITSKFNKEWSRSIPADYFDIEYTQNNGAILKGIRADVNPLESGNYYSLDVPKEVTAIKTNAFTDKEWFKNIRSLYIPKTVETIGGRAFSGLTGVNEIDLTDYDDIPSWSQAKNLFDNQDFKVPGGFVWTNQIGDINTLNNDILGWGLPNLWEAYNADSVSSPGDFNMNSDHTILYGITQTAESYEKWKHIKVIKIPSTVKQISINAFENLVDHPLEQDQGTTSSYKYKTRRLILNNNLQTLPENAFMSAGIGGPIVVYCDNLSKIPSMCFQNLNNYGYPGLLDVEVEPTHLLLTDCFNIEMFDSYCFNMTPLVNYDFEFPLSTKLINDYAFQGHQFHTIKFSKNINEVGNRCFSNLASYPENKTLESIDLSAYDYIQNPRASESEQTYIPSWMSQQYDYCFEGACVEDGTHYIYVSKELWKEVQESEKGFDDWQSKFLERHGIPDNWKLAIKS